MFLLGATRRICWRCRFNRPENLLSPIISLKYHPQSIRALASVSDNQTPIDLARTRNIGIIAHIDAGKTTTTERMLYYSGFTRRIGEVDEGSTVMDYLPAERQRGITITSAAITFNWTPPSSVRHVINLIDTPGHADFTFEVERSIRVLDGAVTILDGVAGVEAQTEKVWRQAAKYQIPRIIFVNKLDRVGARFGMTVQEVAAKLNGWPAVLQLPFYENDGRGGDEVLRGVVDLVEKRVFLYELGGNGENISVHDYAWLKNNNPTLHAEALAGREALVELLSEHDSDLVELFLEVENHELIPAGAIKTALRKLTLTGSGRIIPIICGASFRNIGVQPLLDAVVDYLPSPYDRPPADIIYGTNQRAVLDVDTNPLCALAFKVINDSKRGVMVFVRVYSGTLTRAQTLFNTTLGVKERAHRLLQMYADETVDIPSISCGHIGVIIGLKQARTGDTLVSEASTISPKPKYGKSPPQKIDHKTLRLRPIEVPPPVFFASLEPYSISEQKPLMDALAMLLREDPSLMVTTDPDSGQTLLSGMGELHLEIARDRLVNDLKAKADMGKILIAYHEAVTTPSAPVFSLIDREIGKAGCTVSVRPFSDSFHVSGTSKSSDTANSFDLSTIEVDGNAIVMDIVEHIPDPDSPSLIQTKLPQHLSKSAVTTALISGATAALSRGPYLGFPLRDTHVSLKLSPHTDLFSTLSTPAAISTAARAATTNALRAAHELSPAAIVEPVMSVAVSCDERDLGKVVADISAARGGHVISLGDDFDTEGSEIELRRVYVPKIGAGVNSGSSSKGNAGREAGEGRKRIVNARVPLGEMVGYLKHLRSMTQGRGNFVMAVEGWERMQGPRAREVEKSIKGE